ncbi:MAG: A1 family peptidase [Gammaproteobacteria bacterium]|nr:A1 family peptidase [Gammaproteobacteria bacterium]
MTELEPSDMTHSNDYFSFPITNVYAKGGYTLSIFIGSEAASANLILDTGSSTLVVQAEDYDLAADDHLTPTSLAQSVTYGIGGWYGPVVKTKVALVTEDHLENVKLESTHVAVAEKTKNKNFALADGIIGLAYYELNKAYDLTSYLEHHKVNPSVTYPWFACEENRDRSVTEFKSFLKQYPRQHLKPYFTQLTEHNVVANQFAFYIHRSSIFQTESQKTAEQLEQEPLNQGIFVMGMPRLRTDLYEGSFSVVKVLDDKYYNVHVESLQVGDCEPRKAPLLKEINQRYRSNGIVDTGASAIVLPKCLFDQLLEDLASVDPEFDKILEPYKTFEYVEEGVPIDQVAIEKWPIIKFNLMGFNDETVTLELAPEHYWQLHAPEPNQASFQFIFLEKWPNQCILGLPLLVPHYTIFDRRECQFGGLFFARKSSV